MDAFFGKYRNSQEELEDLCRYYEMHKGSMDGIMDNMFSADCLADEPRFKEILHNEIETGNLNDYKAFSEESKTKAAKRKEYYTIEAEEAEALRKLKGIDESEESLRMAIVANSRKNADLLDNLATKYAGKKRDKKRAAFEEDNDSNELQAPSAKAMSSTTRKTIDKANKPPIAASDGQKTKRLKRLK